MAIGAFGKESRRENVLFKPKLEQWIGVSGSKSDDFYGSSYSNLTNTVDRWGCVPDFAQLNRFQGFWVARNENGDFADAIFISSKDLPLPGNPYCVFCVNPRKLILYEAVKREYGEDKSVYSPISYRDWNLEGKELLIDKRRYVRIDIKKETKSKIESEPNIWAMQDFGFTSTWHGQGSSHSGGGTSLIFLKDGSVEWAEWIKDDDEESGNLKLQKGSFFIEANKVWVFFPDVGVRIGVFNPDGATLSIDGFGTLEVDSTGYWMGSR